MNNITIAINSTSYPRLLKETVDAPKQLFVLGDSSLLNAPQIAIVGSRNPTKSGAEIAFHFAQELAEAGLVITSGMALGIDAQSHLGALAAHGKTIAVTGTGIDLIYPMRHKKLQEQILAGGGAIVTEFPPGTQARPGNFPSRNRIISGLSYGTLVVEATLKSGSLITARLALEQNREVFAIPGSILNPASAGCNLLISQGAKLATKCEDILEELKNFLPQTKPRGDNNMVDNPRVVPTIKLKDEGYIDLDCKKILDCIGYEPTSMDQLIARSGFSIGKIATLLIKLQKLNLIAEEFGAYIKCLNAQLKIDEKKQ